MTEDLFVEKGPLVNYSIQDGNIVFAILRKNVSLSVENQAAQVKETLLRCGGPYYVIQDISEVRPMSKAERDFSKSQLVREATHAMAFIVRNPFAKIIASLYMGLTGSAVPTRAFTSYEDAHEWILEMKSQDSKS
jgi:hypothetical protein